LAKCTGPGISVTLPSRNSTLIRRHRVRDWINGVRAAAPEKETKQALEVDPLYEAERLRIIYQLITNPTSEGGAGITPKSGEWKDVESVFPLHDRDGNKKLMKKLSTSYFLSVQDLDEIRDKFGEKVYLLREDYSVGNADMRDYRLRTTSPSRSHTSRS
jgi:hypothetical protein